MFFAGSEYSSKASIRDEAKGKKEGKWKSDFSLKNLGPCSRPRRVDDPCRFVSYGIMDIPIRITRDSLIYPVTSNGEIGQIDRQSRSIGDIIRRG